MKIIQNFCLDSETISINTSSINCLDTCSLAINHLTDEIKRTRYSKNMDCIFNLELNLIESITLDEEIEIMKTIETYYPDTFNWRFNGIHIECYALIQMKQDDLGIYSRFRGIYAFIKLLREQLTRICRYRGLNTYYVTNIIDNMIFSNGSINHISDLYVVPIDAFDNKQTILLNSKNRIIKNDDLKVLNMKYWIREINPDFERQPAPELKEKIQITDTVHTLYPPCIKNVANLPRKGNYGRFLLASFLLAIHGERDAKHQLLTMLSDDEREHVENGNCKDQWRAILNRKYPAPSCKKMIENGYCTENCGRPCPAYFPTTSEEQK